MARKKAAAPAKYTVLRDTCEKAGHGWVFDASKTCAGTVPRNLYTGDYSLEGYYEDKTFVIERKGSVAELAGNLTNAEKWDDFRQELERLEEFRFPFLVLEFSPALLEAFPAGSGIPRSRWARMKVRGPYLLRRVCELELKYRTRVVWAGDAETAKSYASCLFKRVVESCPR